MGKEVDLKVSRRTILKAGIMAGVGSLWSGMNLVRWNSVSALPGGFWPVMMTPFTDDLKIDYPALKRLITWYEESGSAGLFANCGSSEMFQLEPEERLELTRFVVRHSRLPVVSTGSFSAKTEENVEFIQKIAGTGVEAVVLIPSVLVDRNAPESELARAFEAIMAETRGVPLGIYECPGPYHRLVSPELLSDLQATNRFLYFKDTSCDASVVREKIEGTAESNLGIYNAHSPDALTSIRDGGAGISCIAGNFYPELFAFLWKNGRRGNHPGPAVRAVNEFIIQNDSRIGRKYPLAAKYFMNLRGLNILVNTRKGTPPLDQEDRDRLDKIWSDLNQLSATYDIELG